MTILKNKHVPEYQPFAFSVYESDGLTTITLDEDTPAVILKEDPTAPCKAILKRNFQKAHRGELPDHELKKVEQLYGMPIEQFRTKMRTVGCGTTVFLNLKDGLQLLSVQRSAPSQTPGGVVMPGAFSRAAGGATGDIEDSAYREFTEECFVGYKTDQNQILSLDIIPSNTSLENAVIETYLDEKHKRAAQVFAQSVDYNSEEIVHHRVLAERLAVPNLTTDVKQVIQGKEKLLKDYVVVDNPENGDVSGVDSLLFVDLDEINSSDLIICDGETDLDGNLMNRIWFVKKPEEWHEMLISGSAKFSPAYAEVVKSHNSVERVISNLPSLK